MKQVQHTADRYFREFRLEGYYDQGAYRKRFRDMFIDQELELYEQLNNNFVGSPQITKSAFHVFEREFNKDIVPKAIFGRAVLSLPREKLDNMLELAMDRRNQRKLAKATKHLAKYLCKQYAEQHPAVPKVPVEKIEESLTEYHNNCKSFQASWEHTLKIGPALVQRIAFPSELDETEGTDAENITMGGQFRGRPPEHVAAVSETTDPVRKQISILDAAKPRMDVLKEVPTNLDNNMLSALAVTAHEEGRNIIEIVDEIINDKVMTKHVKRANIGDSSFICGTNERNTIKIYNAWSYEVKSKMINSLRKKRKAQAKQGSPSSKNTETGNTSHKVKYHCGTQLRTQKQRKSQPDQTNSISLNITPSSQVNIDHQTLPKKITSRHSMVTNANSDPLLRLTDHNRRVTITESPEQAFATAELHADCDVGPTEVILSESAKKGHKRKRERAAKGVSISRDGTVNSNKSVFVNSNTDRAESCLNILLANSIENSLDKSRTIHKTTLFSDPSKEILSSACLVSASFRAPAVPCFESSSTTQDVSKTKDHYEVRLSAPVTPLTATTLDPSFESVGLVNLGSSDIPSQKDVIDNRTGAKVAHGLATPCESPREHSQDEPREIGVLVQSEESVSQQVEENIKTYKICDNDEKSNLHDDELYGQARLERIYKESTSNDNTRSDHLPIIRRVRKAKIGLRAYVRELQNGELVNYESWMFAQFDATGLKLNVTRAFEAHGRYEEFLQQAYGNNCEPQIDSSSGGAVQNEEASVHIKDILNKSETFPVVAVPEGVPTQQKSAGALPAHDTVKAQDPILPMPDVRSETTSRFFGTPSPTKTTTSPKKKVLAGISCIQFPPLSARSFGLIQEVLADDPFQLLAAVIFLNKTRGTVALPVFWKLMDRWPTQKDLSSAEFEDVLGMIQHLGLQNVRAAKLIGLAKLWLEDPPIKGRRHRTMHYPERHAGKGIQTGEILDDADERLGAWEIAHLPGCGDYACDSWRIFCRDKLRGVAEGYQGEGAGAKFEPEWKRVLPRDKELRAYLRWMWLREGWEWNADNGEKVKASEELMESAERGNIDWEEWEKSKNIATRKAKVESRDSPVKLILTPSTRVASMVSNTDQHTPLTRSMMVPRRSTRARKRRRDGPLETAVNRPAKRVRTRESIRTVPEKDSGR